MKKFVFILSFMFVMIFANTTFAGTADNSLVNEKPQVGLTKNKLTFEKNSIVKEETILEVRLDMQIMDVKLICSRLCYYSSGELVGCTEWVCTEELEGITLEG